RVVIAAGGLFLGVALAGMSLVAELWQPYVLYGLVAALGMGTAYVPCNTTVVKWFVARRGLAVGLASSGASVGTFALPPLARRLGRLDRRHRRRRGPSRHGRGLGPDRAQAGRRGRDGAPGRRLPRLPPRRPRPPPALRRRARLRVLVRRDLHALPRDRRRLLR